MEIQVNHVQYSYLSDRPVLKDITFTYRTPEILCLLGANGIGKSTLLKCLINEVPLRAGNILIDGKDIKTYTQKELSHKMAYIPQSYTAMFPFSVIDVVMMGRTSRIGYFATPGEEDRKIAKAKLQYLQIEHLQNLPYNRLSGGEQQLVLIASALAQEPELIIFDEPTAHLDFGHQYRFIKLVEQLSQSGMGIIMTTHIPDHALELNCIIGVLKDGELQAFGPTDIVLTEVMMNSVYGLKTNIRTIGNRVICIPGELYE